MNILLFTILSGTLFFSLYFFVKAVQLDSTFVSPKKVHIPRYHFVLIPEEMNNPYWEQVRKGAKSAAKKLDVAIEYNGPLQSDIDQHIESMEKAIASKVDGIITPGMSEQLVPVINKAIARNIPVVTIDTDAQKSDRVTYIGTNNFIAGRLAGQTLTKMTTGNVKVAIITGSLTSNSQKQRVAGFKSVVQKHTNINVVAVKASHITRVQAAEQTYEILINHPNVTAFFGTSALDALGISATIQRLGKSEDVYILAFDTLPDTLQLMRKGYIEATIQQKPLQMGVKAVRSLVSVKQGNHVSPVQYTNVQVVLPEDLPLIKKVEGGST